MSVEEVKERARIEKERLVIRICLYSSEYTPEQLRGMKLKKLQEIAAKLNLQ